MTPYIIRLTSGEELIAQIENTPDDQHVQIKDVVIILPTSSGSIQIAPFMPYAKKEKIAIRADKVMFIVEPHEDLANEYKSIFSAIFTPEDKKIIQ